MTNPPPDPQGGLKKYASIIGGVMTVVGVLGLTLTDALKELWHHGSLSFIIDSFLKNWWEYGMGILTVLGVLITTISLGSFIVWWFSFGLRSKIAKLKSLVESLGKQHDLLNGTLNHINNELRPAVNKMTKFALLNPIAGGKDGPDYLRSPLMSRPDDYYQIIRNMRYNLCGEEPPKHITILGSMVGFTLTISKQLGKLAAETRTNLNELTIIGPHGTGYRDTVGYDLIWPVWHFQLNLP